jgi:hypothetical protein
VEAGALEDEELVGAPEDAVDEPDGPVADPLGAPVVAVMPGGGEELVCFSACEPFMKIAVVAAAMKAMTSAPRSIQIQL